MASSPGAPCVLLVEPDSDTREMYAQFLRQSGLDVIPVDNAVDALARAREAGIVVTGIHLCGDLDGVELVHRLRRDGPTKKTPVIVLTACAWQPERERAQRAGCNVFLSKPCLPDELLAEVRQLWRLAKVRARRQAAYAKTDILRDRSDRPLKTGQAIQNRRRKSGG